MTNYKFICLLFILLSVFSCKKSDKVNYYEIKSYYETPVLTSNYSQCMKSDGSGFCYLYNSDNKFFLSYLDLDFENARTFEIPIGKGPGEIQVSGGVSIYNNEYYILDLISRKLEIYGKDGKHRDTFFLILLI